MHMGECANLLVEFLSEELPPINLETDIGNAFGNTLATHLKNFIRDKAQLTIFVTPRRFGCIIPNIFLTEADAINVRRGPAINNGLQGGTPTPALLGFAKSCNVEWNDLEQNSDGYFYAKVAIKGRKLEEVITDAIHTTLKSLPIAKNMRWGSNEYSFVRPLHNLVIMHGDKVIAGNQQILGLTPVNYTYGHRFMSSGKVTIPHADTYLANIQSKGMVIPEFNQRMQNIKEQLQLAASKLGLLLNEMPGLLSEVTALVEYPVVLQGEFHPDFLRVPPECLILSMAKNQKYFALLDINKNLSNKFLFVANIQSGQPEIIIHGNEKVLTARLQDARFFFEVDKNHSLGFFVDKLSHVIYHNKLGSQLDRVIRLQNIASEIARQFHTQLEIEPDIARSTAYLLKADLVSEMVGEFPELQGTMGKYYAKLQGEPDEVALAIEQHYSPRFSGDSLPQSNLAIIMALADKLETIVGIWGIGLIPSGDKDQFALRRCALGIVRILLEYNLDIQVLLHTVFTNFAEKYSLSSTTTDEVYHFILSRVENYFSPNYSINCIRSVLNKHPKTFVQIPGILDKLNNFAQDEKNQAILQANKRIENILSKNNFLENADLHEFDQALVKEPAEKALCIHWQNVEGEAMNYILHNNWEGYFNVLSSFNQPVSNFFDGVMVMVDNPQIQKNRLALLSKLYNLSNQMCKLSELG